jgi:hypothetical protein
MKPSKKIIGAYSAELVGKGDLSRSYLNHADPHARLAALLFLRDSGQRPPDFSQVCERLAFEDTDLNVRCCALTGLGLFHWRTSDISVGRLLAGFARDETQPDLFRKLAYFNLFSITGKEEHPDLQNLRFPADVDWKFVESFLQSQGPNDGRSESVDLLGQAPKSQ